MKTGVELIAEERDRQINQEGWTAEHDSQHENGALAVAGGCYAFHAGANLQDGTDDILPEPLCWTLPGNWWKPKSPMRDLVRAGALIAAEIDRLIAGGEEEVKI